MLSCFVLRVTDAIKNEIGSRMLSCFVLRVTDALKNEIGSRMLSCFILKIWRGPKAAMIFRLSILVKLQHCKNSRNNFIICGTSVYPANFMPCFPCKYHVNNMKKFHVNCMEVPWNPAGICPLIACYLHGDDVMKNLYICVLFAWRNFVQKNSVASNDALIRNFKINEIFCLDCDIYF